MSEPVMQMSCGSLISADGLMFWPDLIARRDCFIVQQVISGQCVRVNGAGGGL
jgi:hypothetical protein